MDTQKLKELLEAALQSGLRLPTPAPWIVGTEAEKLLRRFVSADDSIEEQIVAYMHTQPDLSTFSNKTFNQGSHGSLVTYRTLLQWLLYTSTTQSIDAALEKLETYLALDFNPAVEILALSGIEVDKSYQITPAIQILPFSHIPFSPIKEILDPEILKPEVLGRLMPLSMPAPMPQRATAALIANVKLRPKSFDNPVAPHHKISNAMYELCECLTLVGQATPLPIAHSFALEEWVPCAGFLGAGLSSPLHDVINPSAFQLSTQDVNSASGICQKFLLLNQETRDKLRVPIQRLNQARRRQSIADKAIDLGIAFEALLLGDRSHKEQISFTFRLRAAWHLGKTPEDRERLMEAFSKIYECRSVAVHTGRLDSTIKVKRRGKVDTSEFLREADKLCVQAIGSIIDRGEFPEWNQIILG